MWREENGEQRGENGESVRCMQIRVHSIEYGIWYEEVTDERESREGVCEVRGEEWTMEHRKCREWGKL